MTDFNVGDKIEVAFTTDDATIWNPAKVAKIQHDRVIVEYPGGERRAIPNNPKRFRVPKNTQVVTIDRQPAPDKVTRMETFDDLLKGDFE